MNNKCLIAAVLLLGSYTRANPQISQEARDDFRLGATVASCLVVKCQVFRGYLTTDLPNGGNPVLVRVQEWLYGESGELEIVPLSLANRTLAKSSSTAWRGVPMTKNTSVTVVLSQEQGFGVLPGETVLITDGERESDLVRMLAAEARKLQISPLSSSQTSASLPMRPSSALAAYLLTYALLSKSLPDRESRTEILLHLLANTSVPPERWADIAAWLTTDYYALPKPTRERVVRRLSELCLHADVSAAGAAFRGLAKIAAMDDAAMRTMISPTVLAKLAAGYGVLLKKGAIPRLTSLESGWSAK